MADLQEEMSFAHSEARESDQIDDFEVEDYHRHYYQILIQQIKKAYKADEEPQKKHYQTLLKQLQRNMLKNQKNFDDGLADITKDKAEAFALLQMASQDDALSPEIKRKLDALTHHWADKNISSIQAGINSIELAKKTESQSWY